MVFPAIGAHPYGASPAARNLSSAQAESFH
jgi:hypothetical protein